MLEGTVRPGGPILRRAALIIVSVSLAFGVVGSPAAADAPADDLRTRLREVRAELRTTLDALARVGSQRDVATVERTEAEADAAAARADARAWRIATYAVLGLMAGIGLAAMVRRRSTVRIRIPDTPDELLEESWNPRDG
jgi:hypothetical protein